jgi:hypothetical protein
LQNNKTQAQIAEEVRKQVDLSQIENGEAYFDVSPYSDHEG